MDINKIKKMKIGKVLENEYMKDHTTYKVGGKVNAVILPKSINDLVKLLKEFKKNNVNYKIIGNGSNLIFEDRDYDLFIIKLDELNDVKFIGTKIVVGAGYNLMKLAIQTAKLGLTGLEFATGIPGSIGGAVYMNAGAYNSDMGYFVSEVKVLTPDLKVITMYNRDLDFHYRTSFLQKNPGYICLEATLILKNGQKDLIMEVIEDRKKRRLMSQPLEFPSAGSVFRNPEGDYAGRLIEEIGYKGKKIGGAKVSEKHANFIINNGNAKGEEVIKLIEEIKQIVKEKYNIELKLEQEIVK